MNKQTHKPFSKPFFRLLGTSIMALIIVGGGLVWANGEIDPCEKKDGEYVLGKICAQLGHETSDRVATIGIPDVPSTGDDDFSAEQKGQTLRFERVDDPGNTKAYFLPAKYKREIESLTGAIHEGNRLPMTVCQVGVKNDNIDIKNFTDKNGVKVAGCIDCVDTCNGTWNQNGKPNTLGVAFCAGTYPLPINTGYCAGPKGGQSVGYPNTCDFVHGNDVGACISDPKCDWRTNATNMSCNTFLNPTDCATKPTCTWKDSPSFAHETQVDVECTGDINTCAQQNSACTWGCEGGTAGTCTIDDENLDPTNKYTCNTGLPINESGTSGTYTWDCSGSGGLDTKSCAMPTPFC